MIDPDAVYGVWNGDKLEIIGTPIAIRKYHPSYSDDMLDSMMMGYRNKGRVVRLLTPSDKGVRGRNKWRDIAARHLRDDEGLDYDEIARILNVTPYTAMTGVSRARCGRV